MASLAQLESDVAQYLNRQDILTNGVMPGWVSMLETELAQTLRARCMVKSGIQPIDANYIALPADFAAMESIRDDTSGEMLKLMDEWQGHWTETYQMRWGAGIYTAISLPGPAIAYRLVGNCIEFLPHPVIPDPPDPTWAPQQVLMGWYAAPQPLLQPTDTNAILENHYAVYLYGLCKIGAGFEFDQARAAQMDALYQQAVTRADLHKQQSDYSGAPYTELMAVTF